jgi:hypothetical protein
MSFGKHPSGLVPFLTGTSHALCRLDPHAAFPDTRSRSPNKPSVPKNVPDRNPVELRFHANTRLVGVCATFKQFSTLEQNPALGFFSRPAHPPLTQPLGGSLQSKVKEMKFTTTVNIQPFERTYSFDFIDFLSKILPDFGITEEK